MKLRTLGFAAITVGLTLCFACGEDSKDTSGTGGNTGAATGGSTGEVGGATGKSTTTASTTGGGNNTSTATGGGTSDTPTNDKKCLASIDETKKVDDAVAACKQFCKIYYKCADSNADSEATCLDYLGCDEWGTGSAACIEISKVYWACVNDHTSNQCGARTCCDAALGTAMQDACAT